MPNIAKVLKEEISRISRHEAKVAFTPLQRRTIKLERAAADLKRRTASLEKANKQLHERLAKIEAAQPAAPAPEPAGRAWISGKGVKSLRQKLGLTQKEFGGLTGVTEHAVQLWESKPGMLRLRDATKTAIMAVRGIGKTEARKRLEALKPVAKAKGKKAVLRRRK